MYIIYNTRYKQNSNFKMNLIILEKSVRRNNYFINVTFEYTAPEKKDDTKKYYNINKSPTCIINTNNGVNVFIDPNIKEFENYLMNIKQLKRGETLKKFKTINIFNYNNTFYGKKYLIDYVFFISNDRTKKYVKDFDENLFKQIETINSESFFTLDSEKLEKDNKNFFNPFHIWKYNNNISNKSFVLLNKDLFAINKDDVIDPIKKNNYRLIINNTLIPNRLDTLDPFNKFTSSGTQLNISTKTDKKNFIWIIVVVFIFVIVLTIIIGVVVHKKKERQTIKQNIMSKL